MPSLYDPHCVCSLSQRHIPLKVLYYNNFPTDILWREWKAGASPAHHLWGVPGMQQRGLQVDILPFEKYRWLKRISKWIKLLGDLDQQVRVLRRASHYDIIYCGCQHDALLLGLFRYFGWLKTPVVLTMHHMVNPVFRSETMFKWFFGSISSFVCLHRRVANELVSAYRVQTHRVEVIEWGGDAAFYEQAASPSSEPAEPEQAFSVVAAGQTFRDYGTLIRAVSDSDIRVNIFCTHDAVPGERLSPNITIHEQDTLSTLQALLAHYAQASVIAIPMVHLPDKLIGLTSLIDAMGMGKPVVMTRNAHIDIDIEGEGIGIWVEPGDEEAWRRSLQYLQQNRGTAAAMGRRARALLQGRYHIDRFAAQLTAHLERVQARV